MLNILNMLFVARDHVCRHPVSRDWDMPDMPCKATSCVANMSNKCICPSRIKIGADHKCEGFKQTLTKVV